MKNTGRRRLAVLRQQRRQNRVEKCCRKESSDYPLGMQSAEGAVRAISHGIIIISGGGGADFCADERANEFIHRRRDTRALARCRCHNDDNSSPALFAFALY
jgi:hypothetical protein